MSTLYLHGIVPAGTGAIAHLPAHRLVAAGTVAGIATSGPAGFASEAETVAAVLAHDRLLAGYLARGPVLPVRFGTAFSSSAAVAERLATGAAEATRHLAALDGAAEYGLVVEAAPLPARSDPRPDPAPTGGRAFLMQRRDRRDAAHLLATGRKAALGRLAAAAAQLSRRSLPRPPRPPRLMALALLMEPAAEAELRALLEVWQADLPDLTARLDGPFPAYSFSGHEEVHPV